MTPLYKKRLEERIGSLALLYEPTHEVKAQGYIAAGRIRAAEQVEDDGRVTVHFHPAEFFMFPSHVPFRMSGKRMETELAEDGRTGVTVRGISKDDFLAIMEAGFRGRERVPYALMRAIDADDDPGLRAAEDGGPFTA